MSGFEEWVEPGGAREGADGAADGVVVGEEYVHDVRGEVTVCGSYEDELGVIGGCGGHG